MKLVILAHNDPFASVFLSELIKGNTEHSIEAIVFSKRISYNNSASELFKQVVKISGLRFAFCKSLEVIGLRTVYFIKDIFAIATPSLNKYVKINRTKIIFCDNVNSDSFIDQIAALKPDLAICSRFNQILGTRILNTPKFGCVNFHGALLPKYKGLCSTFHAVYNGEKSVGYTLHFMNEKIDEGRVIQQNTLSISEEDSLLALDRKIHLLGAVDLIDTLIKIEKDNLDTDTHAAMEKGNYYSWPDKNKTNAMTKKHVKFLSFRDFVEFFRI